MPTANPILAISFEIGGAALALRAAHAKEVLPMLELHAVPEMPVILDGFVLLEEGLVPVIDLAALLRVQPIGTPILNRQIVVAAHQARSLAWITDREVKLTSFRPEDLASVPPHTHLNQCAEGVLTRTGQAPLTLLDPERLLLEGERAALEQMRARAEERLSLRAIHA